MQLDVSTTLQLLQLARAALAVEGLCVESLDVRWGALHQGAVLATKAITAVQQLCRGLQGLRLLVTCGPRHSCQEDKARCSDMRQQLLQGLQQAVQERSVEVRSAEYPE